MGLRKPGVRVGDVLEVFVDDPAADAEDEGGGEVLEVEVLGQMQMCWHFTGFEERTGRYFSLFIDSGGRLWHQEFWPVTYPGEHEGNG